MCRIKGLGVISDRDLLADIGTGDRDQAGTGLVNPRDFKFALTDILMESYLHESVEYRNNWGNVECAAGKDCKSARRSRTRRLLPGFLGPVNVTFKARESGESLHTGAVVLCPRSAN